VVKVALAPQPLVGKLATPVVGPELTAGMVNDGADRASPVSEAARVYPLAALVCTVRFTTWLWRLLSMDGSRDNENDGVSLVKVSVCPTVTVTPVEDAPNFTVPVVPVSTVRGPAFTVLIVEL
jgi:hypothetical protein